MTKSIYIPAIALLLILGVIFIRSADSKDVALANESQPIELGEVDWIRSFDQGAKLAKSQNKPLLVLFQEVPGCSTASGYGKNVLSHPLIVEAIETLFVPVAIYNNHGGEDERVLKSFGEPSWNNPVVRIMTPERVELTNRLSGNYTKAGLVKSMTDSLKNSGREVPEYLVLLNEELSARSNGVEKAAFGMHCFWTGEGKLGAIEGVISTDPGFMGGGEVVVVEYDPGVVSYSELIKKAKKSDVASRLFIYEPDQVETAVGIIGESRVKSKSNFTRDSEPKYYLSKTAYKYLPMTATQASRVNSAIGRGESPNRFLSPAQLKMLETISKKDDLPWKEATGVDYSQAWKSAAMISFQSGSGNES